jgi:hypothetical protein
MSKKVERKLKWIQRIPLYQNTFILKSIGFVILASFSILLLIVFSIFLFEGNAGQFIDALPGLGIALLIICALFLIATWIVMGNGYRAEFTVSKEGVLMEGKDSRAKKLSWLAFVTGLLAGKPGVAGAGMLGMSRNTYHIPWQKVKSIKYNSKRYIITIKQHGLKQIDLYCNREDYIKTATAVKRLFDRYGTTMV